MPAANRVAAAGIGAAQDVCLELRNISKHYPGVVANDNVSLCVQTGEVLAILGENGAGKSTLMKIVGGLTAADVGEIFVWGKPARIRRPKDARELGIGMVHQHFMLVPDMTVAENLALGQPGALTAPSAVGAARRRVNELADRYEFGISPNTLIEDLSVGERQRVEILKLLDADARILIFDEPTAVLAQREWEHLAGVLSSLAQAGRTIILITHKLHEVFEASTRCVVLRSGRLVGSVNTADTTPDAVVEMMIGRSVDLHREATHDQIGDVALELAHVWLRDDDGRQRLVDVSLKVHDGEILGIAGIEGNGQSQLIDVACGFRNPDEGTVTLAGRNITNLGPAKQVDPDLAVIPEDRHRDGVALPMSVSDNMLIKELHNPRLFRRGWRQAARIRERDNQLIEQFDIRIPHADVYMRQLSGGNQQKVVLARELSRQPRVVIAAQPTRGLDVGAMEFVYNALRTHRNRGGATLLVSSELDELILLADRIAVMVDGRIVGTFDANDASVEKIGRLMISGVGSDG